MCLKMCVFACLCDSDCASEAVQEQEGKWLVGGWMSVCVGVWVLVSVGEGV